ncbi:extracellular sulfatase SULF-1 homolog [Nylanderia fulva]|uniref:extracellular sulfatase SULF-1 homolog n=1 Tax=Nylanderia fulva TaxID=613905 RepID=UPI0010FB578F|nr:extracellular sulfatase SULF-1 homolog [Nylanderia fulva]
MRAYGYKKSIRKVDDIVLNIDLAPTFLDIAGVETPPQMDGRSFKKLFLNGKHGRRLKFKWPDTFLIESSGRRETPESIAESRAREAKRQNATQAKQSSSSTLPEENDDIPDADADAETEHRFTESDIGSDQDISDDEDLEDSIIDETSSDPHLDNRVHSPFATKHERLAAECSRPEAQADCLPGQKWRCERDGHRWRRHKCRYAVPTPQRVSSKKCACFTPHGVVYTRLESNDYDGQRYSPPRDHRLADPYDDARGYVSKRGKREVSDEEFFDYFNLEDDRDRRAIDEEDDENFLQELDMLAQEVYETARARDGNEIRNMDVRDDESNRQDKPVLDYLDYGYTMDDFDLTLDKVIKGRLNVDDVVKRHRRVRRSVTKKDPIEHVTKIMESIEEELDDLKQTQVRHSSEIEKSPKCLVLPEGGVNCTEAVYQDPNEWRISRREIEQQIREMRMQLETLKEIRRHLMIKRPQFAENEEKLADAEESLDSHKIHHHPPKPHASRHHKKHDKAAHTTTDRDATTESIAKIGTTLSNERVSLTTIEGKLDKYDTTPLEAFTAETFVETSTTTLKPKKTTRRHRTKETSANRTEVEEDKTQRRRKVHHHHRKNNTLLTNSVHDDIPHANTTDISDVASSTTAQDPAMTREARRYTTVPTTVDVFRTSSDFNQDRTTESIAITESGTTGTSMYTTENIPRTSSFVGKGSSSNRPRNTSLTQTTTPLPRKYSKIPRNRTGTLGPARIDVTILEAPERKHKHSIATINNNNSRLPLMNNNPSEARHSCYCAPDTKKDEKDLAREERRRLKEERLKKKERKLRKKAKMEKECLTERMNCFEHDNDHWRTAPLWTAGPFCFCMNANNNTYSCIRTINATHNFLYCEFTTGLVTYYNLRIDPFEQWNRVSSLTSSERSYLHDQLEHLKGCKGTWDCTIGSAKEAVPQLQQHQRYSAKRKYNDAFEDVFAPSTLQIIRESELGGPLNKRRKKLNNWNRRNRRWQNNWRHHQETMNPRRHSNRHQY